MPDVIVGVRCAGERRITFALIDDAGVGAGQHVLIHDQSGTRCGVLVVAPEQMVEFLAPRPNVRAEIDPMPMEPPSGEAADLLKALDLPEDLPR